MRTEDPFATPTKITKTEHILFFFFPPSSNSSFSLILNLHTSMSNSSKDHKAHQLCQLLYIAQNVDMVNSAWLRLRLDSVTAISALVWPLVSLTLSVIFIYHLLNMHSRLESHEPIKSEHIRQTSHDIHIHIYCGVYNMELMPIHQIQLKTLK